MKRPWIKILLLLIPAAAATLFILWRLSPEQGIIRRADAVFSSLEKKTLSSGTPKEKAERFQALLSPNLEIKAPRPLPSDSVPPPVAAALLREFQGNITSCRINREGETVAFPAKDQAIYQAELQADVAVGPNNRRVMRYRCRFEFEKVGESWLLRLIVLTPI